MTSILPFIYTKNLFSTTRQFVLYKHNNQQIDFVYNRYDALTLKNMNY